MIATERLPVPVVRIRGEPIENPDCDRVRDAFLRRWDIDYHEITVWCSLDHRGWHATGTIERGFAEAEERFGRRHISGVRASESAMRSMRMRRWGESSPNTCAPLGWWDGANVWAYMAAHDLPIHPAYAMSFGGTIDRDRLRVAWLGLRHGRGKGREEWERHYYRAEMEALDRGEVPA